MGQQRGRSSGGGCLSLAWPITARRQFVAHAQIMASIDRQCSAFQSPSPPTWMLLMLSLSSFRRLMPRTTAGSAVSSQLVSVRNLSCLHTQPGAAAGRR